MISIDEMQKLADKYYDLKDRVGLSEDDDKNFKKYQDLIFIKLKPFIESKAYRYKNYDNYSDLIQVGYIAAMKAFASFKRGKGYFHWWIKKYIETDISRAANKHSTIRVPITKSKKNKPWKESLYSSSKDTSLIDVETPLSIMEGWESISNFTEYFNSLDDKCKDVIMLYSNMSGNYKQRVKILADTVGMSPKDCLKILREAKAALKIVSEE